MNIKKLVLFFAFASCSLVGVAQGAEYTPKEIVAIPIIQEMEEDWKMMYCGLDQAQNRAAIA